MIGPSRQAAAQSVLQDTKMLEGSVSQSAEITCLRQRSNAKEPMLWDANSAEHSLDTHAREVELMSIRYVLQYAEMGLLLILKLVMIKTLAQMMDVLQVAELMKVGHAIKLLARLFAEMDL
jgi:hypothetical protein